MRSNSTDSRRLVRLALVGAVLPAAFVLIDKLLLYWLSGAYRGEGVMSLTMAAFVAQIGIMGFACGKLTDWPRMRWVLYIWCWILIDFQTLIAWTFADQTWWTYSFQATAVFSAQLNLVLVWGVLGTPRWTVRLPAALAVAVGIGLVLIRARFWSDNAAPLFAAQIAATGIVCLYYRRQGYRLALVSRPSGQQSPGLADQRLSQFAIRDILFWTTCFALVCGLVRLIGLPLEQWRVDKFDVWPSLLFLGTSASGGILVGLWSGLADRSAAWRWSLLLAGLPALGLTAGFVNTMYWIVAYRTWTRPWAARLPWWNWAGWLSNFYQERYTVAWVCLAGGMLFATLLFPRALGYRLIKRPAASNREPSAPRQP